eukprot:7329182-Ditylum_brightwellii.AAC.1
MTKTTKKTTKNKVQSGKKGSHHNSPAYAPTYCICQEALKEATAAKAKSGKKGRHGKGGKSKKGGNGETYDISDLNEFIDMDLCRAYLPSSSPAQQPAVARNGPAPSFLFPTL